MNDDKKLLTLMAGVLIAGLVLLLAVSDLEEDVDEVADMTEATHGENAEPNFDVVFPDDRVNEITIKIAQEDWQLLLADMANTYGPFGTKDQASGLSPSEFMWVEADIYFNELRWENVGFRFKGHASLQAPWELGIMKLPFKLDFDRYEDDYSKMEDQRFYGFEELTMANNLFDGSLLREKVMADIYHEAGLIVPHAAFYAVTIDHGEGPMYFGLYTMVETIDDTLLQTQFEDASGVLYEANGLGSSFSEGEFSLDSFEQENNHFSEDKGDLLALYYALHDQTRVTSPVVWRQGLQKVFDVDLYLHWLAVNTITQNFDSYGNNTKNFYLYHNPDTDQLVWIPWDNNGALKGSPVPLDFAIVGEEWPLIRYLIDDPTYKEIYDNYVRETIEGPFNAETIIARYEYYWSIINPCVRGIHGELPGYSFIYSPGEFEQARLELMSHAYQRRDEVNAYLNSLSDDD